MLYGKIFEFAKKLLVVIGVYISYLTAPSKNYKFFIFSLLFCR